MNDGLPKRVDSSRMNFQQITRENARQILRVNNEWMTAICRESDQGCAVPPWVVSIVSKRIAEAEWVLAAQRRAA